MYGSVRYDTVVSRFGHWLHTHAWSKTTNTLCVDKTITVFHWHTKIILHIIKGAAKYTVDG